MRDVGVDDDVVEVEVVVDVVVADVAVAVAVAGVRTSDSNIGIGAIEGYICTTKQMHQRYRDHTIVRVFITTLVLDSSTKLEMDLREAGCVRFMDRYWR
ncbi:hypothetical protein EYC84_005092 [Monilinia fructicola]|uniref:Uncharacterized protein n=1 Tax=Monilinia fructicola TaxID=38448 RepID=A0A5M9JXY2_MONFR|nr:hypothetical protein EYC84_005092 [Monilinia fructicola]